ncbi:hypothetical protein [Desulfosediminicola sp.]|uniref:hypothetical protein n=1 Tax=Desulfosediminicola sp. TaxID=2886825 RepID=UPI003AF259F0
MKNLGTDHGSFRVVLEVMGHGQSWFCHGHDLAAENGHRSMHQGAQVKCHSNRKYL